MYKHKGFLKFEITNFLQLIGAPLPCTLYYQIHMLFYISMYGWAMWFFFTTTYKKNLLLFKLDFPYFMGFCMQVIGIFYCLFIWCNIEIACVAMQWPCRQAIKNNLFSAILIEMTPPRNELLGQKNWPQVSMKLNSNEQLAPMAIEKNQNPGSRFGATRNTALPIQPIYINTGLSWPNRQCQVY